MSLISQFPQNSVQIQQDQQSQPITRPEIKQIFESLKDCFFQVYKIASLKSTHFNNALANYLPKIVSIGIHIHDHI